MLMLNLSTLEDLIEIYEHARDLDISIVVKNVGMFCSKIFEICVFV